MFHGMASQLSKDIFRNVASFMGQYSLRRHKFGNSWNNQIYKKYSTLKLQNKFFNNNNNNNNNNNKIWPQLWIGFRSLKATES